MAKKEQLTEEQRIDDLIMCAPEDDEEGGPAHGSN